MRTRSEGRDHLLNAERLRARDVLVGCVVENSPVNLGHALRLVQSIRWFGGELASAHVVLCVLGDPDRSTRDALHSYGIEMRVIRPFHERHRAANELQFFSEAWDTDRELLLLLNAGAVVVRDLLPWVRRGTFQAHCVPFPAAPQEVVTRKARELGLSRALRYCDTSVMVLPSELARELVPVWSEYDAQLAGELELHSNRASLSLALAATAVPFAEASPELTFDLNVSDVATPEGSFAIDPAVMHYQDHVDDDGYLRDSRFPLAQVRIEAFNRRVRQEREGRPPRGSSPSLRAPNAEQGTQVVVLGMHRSGTSALTNLLRLSGLWAGDDDDFTPADDHNEAGYWEHRGVWSVDESILQTAGASWSEVADFDLSKVGEVLRARFRERAREIVRELDRHGSWVIKDPRICLVFPFWREILERPFCILIYREPLPVARSLAARDGLPTPYSIALWEKYTLDALASTRDVPRILISHRELMSDPVATLHRLQQAIPGFEMPSAAAIHGVVNPALVHHQQEPAVERSYLNPPQIALLDALQNGSALDLDPLPTLSTSARETLTAYQKLHRAKQRLVVAHHDMMLRRDADLRDAQKTLDTMAEELARAQRTRDADLHDAQKTLDAMAEERARAQRTRDAGLHDAQKTLVTMAEELARAQRTRDADLRDAQKTLVTMAEELARTQRARDHTAKTHAADVQRTQAWIDELDAIVSAILASRAWTIGRTITGTLRKVIGGARVSAPEHRDRVMAEVRKWRSERDD